MFQIEPNIAPVDVTTYLVASIVVNIITLLTGGIGWTIAYILNSRRASQDKKEQDSKKEKEGLVEFAQEQTKVLIDKISEDLGKTETKLGHVEDALGIQGGLLAKSKQKSDEMYLTIRYVHTEIIEASDLVTKSQLIIKEENIESERLNRRLESISQIISSIDKKLMDAIEPSK